MIQELLAQGWSKEQIIRRMVASGTPRPKAEFIFAIETGEISGDMIRVDTRGNEVPLSPEYLLD